jgi:hypothetical protein
MNLFLAIFWFVAAVGCFWLAWENPDLHLILVTGSKVPISSVGWFALVLCGYNMVRWWLTSKTSRRPQPPPPAPRPSPPPVEPDPNFDFTEQTPRRPPTNPPDRP